MTRSSRIACFVVLFLAAPAMSTSGTDGIGKIKTSLGSNSIERAAATVAVASGTELFAGDRIVTAKDGRIGLTFVDNTRFSVGPDSRIALKQFEYDPTTQKGTFIAQVERGTIAVVSGRITSEGRSGMQIETPDATIHPQGTRFIVTVKG